MPWISSLNNKKYTYQYFCQDGVCRFCWRANISTKCIDNDNDVAKIIMEYIGVDLSAGKLKTVCSECLTEIDNFDQFKKMCLEANEKLNKIFSECSAQNAETNEVISEQNFNDLISNIEQDLQILDNDTQKKTCDVDTEQENVSSDNDELKQDEETQDFVTNKENNLPDLVKQEIESSDKEVKHDKESLHLEEGQEKESSDLEVEQEESSHLAAGTDRDTSDFETNRETQEDIPSKVTVNKQNKQKNKSLDFKTVENSIFCEDDISLRYDHCYICKLYFDSMKKKTLHIMEQHMAKENKLECFGCKKTFKILASRIDHELKYCLFINGYNCHICFKHFSEKKHFEVHKKLHKSKNKQVKGKTKCCSCNLWFSTTEEKKKHYLEKHQIEKCSRCNAKFVHSNHRIKHELTSCPVVHGLKCKICSESFKVLEHYIEHMNIHVEEKQSKNAEYGDDDFLPKSNMYCHTCSLHFKSAELKKEHVMKHHKTCGKVYECSGCKLKLKTLSHKIHHELNVCRLIHGRKLKCNICSMKFNSHKLHYAHMKIHKYENVSIDFKCKDCKETFDKLEDLRMHKKESHKNKHICDICGDTFGYAHVMRKHRLTHTEAKLKCPHCDYKTRQENSLQYHIRIHMGEKPFACDKCTYSSATSSNLQRHIRATHLEARPYKCHLCSKEYKSNKTLKDHTARVHIGIKNFKCRRCGTEYIVYKDLVKHMLTKHNQMIRKIKNDYEEVEDRSYKRKIDRVRRDDGPSTLDPSL